MNIIKRQFASGLFALLLLADFSQANAIQEHPSTIPAKMIKPLTAWTGKWEIVTSWRPSEDAPWQDGPVKTVEFSLRQKGLSIMESPTDTSGPGFNMENTYTFDQYREVYRLSAIDDTWGIMDLYAGKQEGGNLVLTNLKAGTGFPLGEGKVRYFKLVVPIEGDNRVKEIYASDDKGKSWFLNFKTRYKRVTP